MESAFIHIRRRGVLLVLLAICPVLLGAADCAAKLKNLGAKQLVYAAPGGSSLDSCGASRDTACASIQHAIDRCSALGAGCTVIVRHGLFSGQPPIRLASGVNVLGGCSLDDSPTVYRTVVRGLPAFTATNIRVPTLLSSFVIVGANATEPSQASIAMTITDSSGLAITDSELVSGKGGDGQKATNSQTTGGGDGQRPPDDQRGGAGGKACASNGAGGGGQGADYDQIYSSGCFTGVCSCTNNNYPNSVGRQGGASGSTRGGYGGYPGTEGAGCGIGRGPGQNIPSCDPGRGNPGDDGFAGAPGSQGGQPSSNVLGSFHGTTWTPAQAGSGDSGTAGSGGGGGGSGGMSVAAGLSSKDYPGEPGGGGGAGGCGGSGGEGGLQGGASIPLVLVRSTVSTSPLATSSFPGRVAGARMVNPAEQAATVDKASTGGRAAVIKPTGTVAIPETLRERAARVAMAAPAAAGAEAAAAMAVRLSESLWSTPNPISAAACASIKRAQVLAVTVAMAAITPQEVTKVSRAFPTTTTPSGLTMTKQSGRYALYLLLAILAIAGVSRAQDAACDAHQPPPADKNFAGKTIDHASFTYQDLTNADFSGATLIATKFIGANLTGANFSNATFRNDPANPLLVNEFTFATLNQTCFRNANFTGANYFTFAALDCANFSQLTLTNQTTIFGEGPLDIALAQGCRVSFERTTIDCEFVSSWAKLNLINANLSACLTGTTLEGQNFDDAVMVGVDFSKPDSSAGQLTDLRKTHFNGANLSDAVFSNTVLDGAQMQGAILTGAKFLDASLVEIDLSGATLPGARFDRANLTHANLYGALLFDNTRGVAQASASFISAHLKNVNLADAKMEGVDFTHANFYSSNPTQNLGCPTTCQGKGCKAYSGFTIACATAHDATITQADFSDAYMAGIDLSGAHGTAVTFSATVLVGANLGDLTLGPDPNTGKSSSLVAALLEGTYFTADMSKLTGMVDFSDSYFDFTDGGNGIYILLDGQYHNAFRCALCDRSAICVNPYYGQGFSVPRSPNIVCPNGQNYPNGCGAAKGGADSPWRSPTNLQNAWYQSNSTFTPASNPSATCQSHPPNQFW